MPTIYKPAKVFSDSVALLLSSSKLGIGSSNLSTRLLLLLSTSTVSLLRPYVNRLSIPFLLNFLLSGLYIYVPSAYLRIRSIPLLVVSSNRFGTYLKGSPSSGTSLVVGLRYPHLVADVL